MIDRILVYVLIFPCAVAGLLSVLVITFRGRVSTFWLWSVATAGLIASFARLVYLERLGTWGIDHRIFWNIGHDLRSGIDPYLPERFLDHPFLNPPSAFPIFALIASLPFRASLIVWGLFYTGLSVVMVWLAQRALLAQDEETAPRLSNAELGALATAFGLSDACMSTVLFGQLSLLATAIILLAMCAQGRNRPLLAGTLLGVATIKVGTMVPFLLLFSTRKNYKAWLALGVTIVVLIILGGHPSRLFDDLHAMLHNIGELSQPKRINDIAYTGPQNSWIFGIDHLAYRLGLRGQGPLFAIQCVVLCTIGAWLAWEIIDARISRALGLSLVSLYSVIFLYHRLYDTVMIVPALVYAVGRAKCRLGRERVLLVVAILSMLAVLYMRTKRLTQLTKWAVDHQGYAASVVEIFILPYGTWLILLSLVCLRLAGDGFELRRDATYSPTRRDEPSAAGSGEEDLGRSPAIVAEGARPDGAADRSRIAIPIAREIAAM